MRSILVVIIRSFQNWTASSKLSTPSSAESVSRFFASRLMRPISCAQMARTSSSRTSPDPFPPASRPMPSPRLISVSRTCGSSPTVCDVAVPLALFGLNPAKDAARLSERGVPGAELAPDSTRRLDVSRSPRRSVKSGRETGVKAPSALLLRREV